MISKLDKVMQNLEKEKMQTGNTEEKSEEELVRIDEVMNVVSKVNRTHNVNCKLTNESISRYISIVIFCCC